MTEQPSDSQPLAGSNVPQSQEIELAPDENEHENEHEKADSAVSVVSPAPTILPIGLESLLANQNLPT